MNEWEFTGQVAGWINEILAKDPSLPFSEAKIERKSSGSQKRHDLTILDRGNQVALTGEIKLPYQKDGNSPYNSTVVEEARKKAHHSGAKFFFTWNVNEFVLWETKPKKFSGLQEQNFKKWEVTSIHSENHFELPMTFHAIHKFLPEFLDDFARIVRGAALIGIKTPDEKFIEALESSLKTPILLTIEALLKLYSKPLFKRDLDQWMRDELGWLIRDDPDGVRDNLERAARFACYTLVNRLVFYEALLKRYSRRLDKIIVPDHIDTGEDLRRHLLGFFEAAVEVTGDYETVFGEDPKVKGNLVPFYSDQAVKSWRELINQIHDFDFSKLDYEIIGNIFERLISPEWRRKYGQFYTRVEVVDLINSFCIRRGDEKIMDPACGGGTFLVRAYARKKELQLQRKHGQLLTEIYGIDIDLFAANLTTINLATRDLIDAENYPQIARSDFFDVAPHAALMYLPTHLKTKGLGKGQHREVSIPELDAVVGNPPYIRQEMIPGDRKKHYQALLREEAKMDLPGRSDIHSYFWPHAAAFLKDDGYLCFLTSSQWLDVEYGFQLQSWMLKNFEIVAIFESVDEPWFVGDRVATAITILKRQDGDAARMNNLVRFVQLRRPLKELLAHDGTTADAVNAVDRFRDEILGLKESVSNDRFRARLIRQGDLWDQGVKLGQIMARSPEPEEDDKSVPHADYYGGKWGMHLRAPDLWFRLMDRYGSGFVPLGEIAEVRFGVKSGKDVFFFPKDHSREGLERFPDDHDFRVAFGAARIEVELGKVKLVRCGEGMEEVRPIEADYLAPEVHSLMEIDGFTVKPEDCARLILLINKKKRELKGQYVLRYIKWGEEKEYHLGSTCKSRVNRNRTWYDLTGHRRGALFWSMAQQYKHVAPVNKHDLICNHNLFDLHVPSEQVDLVAGILNSSLVVLAKYQYGRPVGVEGNLKTEVIDVKMMMSPDFSRAPQRLKNKIASKFGKMKKRKALQFLSERRLREMSYRLQGREEELEALSGLSELDMPDRRELDDAVLELIGVKSKAEREQWLDELYAYLRDFFESVRQKEEKAIVNKKSSRRQGPARPPAIAAQILDDIKETNPHLLFQYERDFLADIKVFDTYEIPEGAEPKKAEDLFTTNGVEFAKKKKSVGFIETRFAAQDDLIMLLARSGQRGTVLVPRGQPECLQVLQQYEKFVKQREAHLRQLVEERTNDPDLQKKIYESLMNLLANQ